MADTVFVIRNQLQQFWTRSGDWVDGREPQRILRLKHRDEAVNQLVELSARDIDLRGEVVACALNERGEPVVEASEHVTPTLAEIAAAKAAAKAREQASEQAGDEEPRPAHDATEDSGGPAAEPGLRDAV